MTGTSKTIALLAITLAPMLAAAPIVDAAAAKIAPSRATAALGPLINIPQTWNNCGPSSVAEVLSYWGINRDQYQVKAVLRGDGNPYGMAPYDVPAYMRSLGMRALMGVGGSDRVVKALISNGFPVIVSQYVSLADKIGHYRPIQAYDDVQGMFVSSDPYLGQNHAIGYSEFDAIWQSTNRRFMVLYPPNKQSVLTAVLQATGWNKSSAYQQDLARQNRLLKEKSRVTTTHPGAKNFYLGIAWDDLQLGRFSASRQALKQAISKGANAIVLGWISGEIAYSTRTATS